MLEINYLKTILRYDAESGLWLSAINTEHHNEDDVVGHKEFHGYIVITIDRRRYKAHRLAWFYMTGKWPENEIDHKNSIRDDNRWENLREAIRNENMHNRPLQRNNSSGIKGVCWHKRARKWIAQIKLNNKIIHLGYFDNIEDAADAHAEATEKYHGAFGKHDESF